ncbi:MULTISPECIES: NADPH-dependent oxidoreductase [Paracoccus]|uniref:NADPH-dependent oxidoreductase n=1 Tax=Paracoccus kondratievae TaxID=135740 RepID=A0AAD3NXL6_9RHOB|nr:MULTISPECIES: NADPH-dependent oxidoreductase [Paracoccus]GLK64481.1 NADPH-dependent oxidoreductase [Paracoccus kondratievae]SMG19881.1 Nitroreductase [Paracoccus sp. J56]
MNIPLTPPQPAEAVDAASRRYREPVPLAGWNPVLASLLDHRSVRAYRPDPLAPGTVETLVAAASSAPTSSNIQAWSVVAVTDPDRRDRLAEIAGGQEHIRQAPLILVWIADLARAEAVADTAGVTLQGLDYTETFLLAAIDAALAAQNALIAAESLGLGTVYIGALRNDPKAVAELLNLPRRAAAVFGLVVGHPDRKVETAVKPRLPQQAVLHHETYSTAPLAEAIARHDRATEAFRAEQSLPPQSWSALLVDRLRDVAALKGRHKLRQTLERLGFILG